MISESRQLTYRTLCIYIILYDTKASARRNLLPAKLGLPVKCASWYEVRACQHSYRGRNAVH